MSNTSVSDVAASQNPTLKVSGESVPNKVAGAICNVVREAQNNTPPAIMATGPAAINQAIKAIAIAKKYLLEEDPAIDLLVAPRFQQDLRDGSNVTFYLDKSRPITREPSEDVRTGLCEYELCVGWVIGSTGSCWSKDHSVQRSTYNQHVCVFHFHLGFVCQGSDRLL